MTKNKLFAPAVGLLMLTMGWAGPAGADAKGDKVLRLLDSAMVRAKDQYFLYRIVTKEPGKDAREMKMKVTVKGEDWRRMDILAPGDMKGMKILIRDMDKMWVYMPQYRKIRRVASHAKAQGFMGTTFTHDDSSLSRYGKVFSFRLLGEDKDQWKVEATRKPGKTFIFPKLILKVHKRYHQVTYVEYYGDSGAKLKTEVRTGFTCKADNICNAREMKMTDHTRNNTWSSFIKQEWKVNTGVGDRYFSVRQLQRGR